MRAARTARFLLGAWVAGALLLAACGDEGVARVRLATTTSARDTGLLEWVLPEVEKREGIRVSVIAVGTGQALDLARRGDADLVIVHDRAKEDAFVAEGWGVDRRDLMWNDFVILGPAADAAGIRGTKEAGEALRKIAAAKAPFVSRGDESGTHSREKSLWAKAGGKPAWGAYVESGQGQGPTLLVASERQAYTLSDRATYASMRKKVELAVLVEGDPALRNPYGVIRVDPAKNPGVAADAASKVHRYLASPEGQARIGAFEVDGERIFHPGAPPR